MREKTALQRAELQRAELQRAELQGDMILQSVQDRNILQFADLPIRERRNPLPTQNRPAKCNRCMWVGKVPTFFHR